MCVNISSIKRIFSNQSHYFPDIPCTFNVKLWRVRLTAVDTKTQQWVPLELLFAYTQLSTTKSLSVAMEMQQCVPFPLLSSYKIVCTVNNIKVLKSSCKLPEFLAGF